MDGAAASLWAARSKSSTAWGFLVEALGRQPAGEVEQPGGARRIAFQARLGGPRLDQRFDLPLEEQVAGVRVAHRPDPSVEGQRGLERGAGSVLAAELLEQLAALDFDPGREPRVATERGSHGFEVRGQGLHLLRALGQARRRRQRGFEAAQSAGMIRARRQYLAEDLARAFGRRAARGKQHAELELASQPLARLGRRVHLGLEQGDGGRGRTQRRQAPGRGDWRGQMGGDSVRGPVFGERGGGIPGRHLEQKAELQAGAGQRGAFAGGRLFDTLARIRDGRIGREAFGVDGAGRIAAHGGKRYGVGTDRERRQWGGRGHARRGSRDGRAGQRRDDRRDRDGHGRHVRRRRQAWRHDRPGLRGTAGHGRHVRRRRSGRRACSRDAAGRPRGRGGSGQRRNRRVLEIRPRRGRRGWRRRGGPRLRRARGRGWRRRGGPRRKGRWAFARWRGRRRRSRRGRRRDDHRRWGDLQEIDLARDLLRGRLGGGRALFTSVRDRFLVVRRAHDCPR